MKKTSLLLVALNIVIACKKPNREIIINDVSKDTTYYFVFKKNEISARLTVNGFVNDSCSIGGYNFAKKTFNNDTLHFEIYNDTFEVNYHSINAKKGKLQMKVLVP